ncbi:MAG: sugar kinase [Verrucomicrobiales bacterium]|nr:sugar kinase [Verrucomicrobiales bacterium]
MGSIDLNLRPADRSRWDLVALGEIMLRLDPGETRVRVARHFQVWEGGGEYNVARGLRRCFGLRTAVCTAFADNDVGRLIEDFVLQGGVAMDYVLWRPFDGVGRSVRNGLNFTERGFGVRGAVGIPDRGHTASAQLKPGDFDWDRIFGDHGVRWLHTGGIFAALSATTADLVIEAVQAAKRHGVIVSYDLNYRPSLWKSIGGQSKAQEVNRRIAPFIDVMIGNEEDFTAALGFQVPGTDEHLLDLNVEAFQAMIETAAKAYPNFRVVATTLRAAKTATINDWGAVCWADGQFYHSKAYGNLEIFDRVGGGDSFASGLIYGLMTTGNPALAVDYGAAHGALAMTTPGDTSMATVKEVEALMKGGGARVQR